MALQESFAKSGNFLFKKRSFLPLLILIPGMAWFVWLNFQKTTITGWWLDLIFLCIGFIGLTIRILTVGFTPKGTSGRNTSEGQVAEVVNTTGIYSVVRHPLYLGNFFMWLAPCLMILNCGSSFSSVLLIGCIMKELCMLKKISYAKNLVINT